MPFLSSALQRLKSAFPERSGSGRVSRARALRFCSIVFGVALPLAFFMCLAMVRYQRSRPAEILSVMPGATPAVATVSYRSRDGSLVTREFGASRRLRDDKGREVCLASFANGSLPYGELTAALRKTGSGSACATPPSR